MLGSYTLGTINQASRDKAARWLCVYGAMTWFRLTFKT